MKDQQAYGVVIVIREEEYKFLILYQDSQFNNWSFPKGKMEEWEIDPVQVAKRELKEETGITDFEVLDFPLIEEKYVLEKGDKVFDRTNKYFLGIVKDKSVKIQEGEILEYKWATYEEAWDTFDFQKDARRGVLKQAKEYLDAYEQRT